MNEGWSLLTDGIRKYLPIAREKRARRVRWIAALLLMLLVGLAVFLARDKRARRARWIAALLLVLLVGLAIFWQSLGPQIPGPAFGIAEGGGLPWLSPTALASELRGIRQLGATWVRFDIDWSVIQAAGPNSYDWHLYDNVVLAAVANNLNVLAVITSTPAWARAQDVASDKCEPNPAAFSSFAETVAHRYSPMGVHCWEIWNEPNLPASWQPTPDPRQYTELLRLSYAAIKAADPDAVVVAGALANGFSVGKNISPLDFVRGMYASGAEGYFDAVSIHPYTYPFLPNDATVRYSWAELPELHQLMTANGDEAKRLWITEYGAPTGGPGGQATTDSSATDAGADHVSETLQSRMASQAIALYRTYHSWAGPFFWYSFRDWGVSPTTRESFFGLLRHNWLKKPAYYALRSLVPAIRPSARSRAR